MLGEMENTVRSQLECILCHHSNSLLNSAETGVQLGIFSQDWMVGWPKQGYFYLNDHKNVCFFLYIYSCRALALLLRDYVFGCYLVLLAQDTFCSASTTNSLELGCFNTVTITSRKVRERILNWVYKLPVANTSMFAGQNLTSSEVKAVPKGLFLLSLL